MTQSNRNLSSLFKYRWLNHLVFWLVITVTTAYHGSLFGGTLMLNLANMSALLPVQILCAYVFIYGLVPKFLFKGKWLEFLLLALFLTGIFLIAARLMVIYVAEPMIRGDVEQETLLQILSDPGYLLMVYFPGVFLPTVLLFLIKMTSERFQLQGRELKLIEEKKTAELNFLKAQMNPHMLFNTLNNIYSLAKKGSEKTPELILKLSEILDYTLYECAETRVKVNREWDLIENFAELEALRHGAQLDLVMVEKIDDLEAEVAPLILIALVENAFKYSLGTGEERPRIEISLHVQDGMLTFRVLNSKSKSTVSSPERDHAGIGMQNIRSQLELLYPNTHQLRTTDGQLSFEAHLTISL